jgi:hypothetical protein
MREMCTVAYGTERSMSSIRIAAMAAIETTCKEVTLGLHGGLNKPGYDRSITLSDSDFLGKMEGAYPDRPIRSLCEFFQIHNIPSERHYCRTFQCRPRHSFNAMPNYRHEIFLLFGGEGSLTDEIGVIACITNTLLSQRQA